MTYLPYAGIGSRQTPKPILGLMYSIGSELARNGFTLRSGGADGADTAFEKGAISAQYRGSMRGSTSGTEIFIPWSNFNGRKFRDGAFIPFQDEKYEEAYKIAAKYHPAWERCSQAAKKLHMRNVAQILGSDLKKPSKFVVCWTRNGSGQGGTGQAIRIAKAYNIPIYDLGLYDFGSDQQKNQLQELATFCEYLVHPEIADPS